MINWTRVKELEQDIGTEVFSEVIELFLDEVESVMKHLEKGGDRANLEQQMHFLKGSALNLGFDQFGAMCSEAEKTAAKGSVTTVPIAGIVNTYFVSKAQFLQKVALY